MRVLIRGRSVRHTSIVFYGTARARVTRSASVGRSSRRLVYSACGARLLGEAHAALMSGTVSIGCDELWYRRSFSRGKPIR